MDILRWEPEFRARMIQICSLIVMAIGVPFVVQYTLIGVPWMSVAVLLTIVVNAGNLAVLRTTGNHMLSGNIAVLSLLCLLLLSNSVSGGFYDPNFGWFYVIPVGAGFLLGGRAALAYGSAVVGITVGFFLLAEQGIVVPDRIPAEMHGIQSLANRLSAIIALFGLVLGFILERNRVHRREQAAREEAEAANEAKSAFLSTLSHELRTPLSSIIGYADLVLEEAEDEEYGRVNQDVGRIRSSGRRLLVLIDAMLDLSKLEAGRVDLIAEKVVVDEVLEEVADAVRPRARTNANELVVSGDPDAALIADRVRLRQVLTNLASNAVRYTQQGTVQITGRQRNGEVVFEVIDDGPGIAADDIPKIWRKFERLDTRIAGTGLGLPISKELCEAMGGRLEVRSVVGEGSTFTATFPVAEA